MLFKEQIDKRLDIEQQNLHEAVGSFVENVGLHYRLREKVTTDAHAVREVLSELNVADDYELDDENPFLTLEEQLKQILSPKGIMYRQVELKGRWWKTAVGPMLGYDKEGNICLVVIDGRHKGQGDGASIYETALICSFLGLTDAINLDGGGSSAIWSSETGVLNHPSDNKIFDHEGERVVPNIIGVF